MDVLCGPCDDDECDGGLHPHPRGDAGCRCFEERGVSDALQRGGGVRVRADLLAQRRGGQHEAREIAENMRRSRGAGSSTDIMDLLIKSTRVAAETWHSLGGDDVRAAGDCSNRRAFEHECSNMCLHGLARHDPEFMKRLFAERKRLRSEQARARQVAVEAPARKESVYQKAGVGGLPSSALHEAAVAELETGPMGEEPIDKGLLRSPRARYSTR